MVTLLGFNNQCLYRFLYLFFLQVHTDEMILLIILQKREHQIDLRPLKRNNCSRIHTKAHQDTPRLTKTYKESALLRKTSCRFVDGLNFVVA